MQYQKHVLKYIYEIIFQYCDVNSYWNNNQICKYKSVNLNISNNVFSEEILPVISNVNSLGLFKIEELLKNIEKGKKDNLEFNVY